MKKQWRVVDDPWTYHHKIKFRVVLANLLGNFNIWNNPTSHDFPYAYSGLLQLYRGCSGISVIEHLYCCHCWQSTIGEIHAWIKQTVKLKSIKGFPRSDKSVTSQDHHHQLSSTRRYMRRHWSRQCLSTKPLSGSMLTNRWSQDLNRLCTPKSSHCSKSCII